MTNCNAMAVTRAIATFLMMVAARHASAQPADETPNPSPQTEPMPPPPTDPAPPPPPVLTPQTSPPVTNVPVALPAPALPAPTSERAICATGSPRPFCRTVFLLEGSVRGGTTTVSALDIGLLVNLGAHDAIGATVGSFGFEHPLASGPARETRPAYKVRYRRWLSKHGELDFGAGVGRFGVVGEVAIGIGDVIAVTGGVNTFPSDSGRQMGANVGVRVGTTGLLYLLYIAAALGGGR